MNERETGFFDKPGNVKTILKVFYAVSAAVVGLDLVFHRHVVHPWEAWFGFYALYGFVACVALVLLAKELRKLVMRDEKYFDDE